MLNDKGDPFEFVPRIDCTYILWYDGKSEFCWANIENNLTINTSGTDVDTEMILSMIDIILKNLPDCLKKKPTWGLTALRPNEMWALCRIDSKKGLDGQAAIGYLDGEIRHLILSSRAHQVLLHDLEMAKKYLTKFGKKIHTDMK